MVSTLQATRALSAPCNLTRQRCAGASAQRATLRARASADDAAAGPSTSGRERGAAVGVATLAAAAASLAACDPALAIHLEPANALSLPTWAIHVSSVVEWAAAMALIWRFAEVTNRPVWKGLTWGMLPAFGSAMCACTWHLYYNSEDLQLLVVLQAALTVVGNCTCAWAAYRIWRSAAAEQAP